MAARLGHTGVVIGGSGGSGDGGSGVRWPEQRKPSPAAAAGRRCRDPEQADHAEQGVESCPGKRACVHTVYVRQNVSQGKSLLLITEQPEQRCRYAELAVSGHRCSVRR